MNCSFKTITNNANTAYVDSIKNTKGNTVIFFCPTNEIDSTIFISNAKELVSNKKLSSFHSIKIHFILFKEDPKNNSKGIIFSSKDKKSSMPIGQLECFFLNFDKSYVQRARSKDKFNFEYTQPFLNENLYRIQIVDTNKCFKEIPDRIPFYADFIKEAYSPSYSLEEKVDFLNDSIRTMQKKIVELSLNNDLIISKLDSLLNKYNVVPTKNNRNNSSNLKNEKSDESEKKKNPEKKEGDKNSKPANTTNTKKELLEKNNQEKPIEQENKSNKN
jgi:hypothetical protein